jgi:hypothetical protein
MPHKIFILMILMLFASNASACSFKVGSSNSQADSKASKSNETAKSEISNDEGIIDTPGDEKNSFAQETKTGTYRYKSGNYNNAIGVEQQSGNRLRISIVANYEYKVDGEWMANSGSASETVALKGDTAVLVPADFPACQITLKFSGNKIVVKQKGTEADCGFGGNTSAEGTYVKTSNELNQNEMIDDAQPITTGESITNSGERIRFAAGKSSTVVSGKITRGEEKIYTIGARAGQTMTIKVTDDGANNDVVFHIIAPDGSRPMGDEEGGGYDSAWSGKLQKSGDYKIVVGTIESENTPFKIQIGIR